MGSLGLALRVFRFIRVRWVHSVSPIIWGRWVRTVAHCVHPWSLGSLEPVGRWVHRR